MKRRIYVSAKSPHFNYLYILLKLNEFNVSCICIFKDDRCNTQSCRRDKVRHEPYCEKCVCSDKLGCVSQSKCVAELLLMCLQSEPWLIIPFTVKPIFNYSWLAFIYLKLKEKILKSWKCICCWQRMPYQVHGELINHRPSPWFTSRATRDPTQRQRQQANSTETGLMIALTAAHTSNNIEPWKVIQPQQISSFLFVSTRSPNRTFILWIYPNLCSSGASFP